MGRNKNLPEQEKEIIAYLYQIKNLSPGAIADVLGYHRNTINKYKDYISSSTRIAVENKKEDRQDIVKKPKNDTQVISLDHF